MILELRSIIKYTANEILGFMLFFNSRVLNIPIRENKMIFYRSYSRTIAPVPPSNILKDWYDDFKRVREAQCIKPKDSIQNALGGMFVQLISLTGNDTLYGIKHYKLFGISSTKIPEKNKIFLEFLKYFDELEMNRNLVPVEFHNFLDTVKLYCVEARVARAVAGPAVEVAERERRQIEARIETLRCRPGQQ